MRWLKLLPLVAALILAACGTDKVKGPTFFADSNPQQLSEWHMLKLNGNTLSLSDRVMPYDLNTPLFSDYAHKLRTVWIPPGKSAKYKPHDTFDLPVGSVITKTFYYQLPSGADRQSGQVLRNSDNTEALLKQGGIKLRSVHLVETRILVHRKEGWVALPYVWNDDQSDAVLKRTGDIKQLQLVREDHSAQPFDYVVPNANQCAGCHATNAETRAIRPIGIKARHLNKDFTYTGGTMNQLAAWTRQSMLSGVPSDTAQVPRNALWGDVSFSIDQRARSYLDINCSHCHNLHGAADTSGLLLEPDSPTGPSLGLCKLPIAAGTGTGGRRFDIVPGYPSQSIFSYRIGSTKPSEMMPEMGRATVHDEGLKLIDDWIAQLRGQCG